MTPESEDNLQVEIGHVLFIDIVGYSKLMIDEQRERLHRLTEIVLATSQVDRSTGEQLVKLPTGDGMALVFRHSSEEPIRCALQVAAALKHHPEIAVRMGVNSGPVSEMTDVSGRTNIAGPGINLAQRVMDCGDAGHILVSQRVAEDLIAYRQWSQQLHSLGDREVKHGVRVHIFNLCTDELGNPELPEKLRSAKPKEQEVSDASARREEGFWVAVLPLKYVGANADLSTLAEGLSEDIVTGLSRFSYLKVIARSSTLRLAKDLGDVRAVGKELGARYVMEGSLRQAGAKLRLAVQVVDTTSGAHLWAENYERTFTPEAVFDLQDDLVPRIVSTVADMYGVLPHSLSEAVRGKDPDKLTPYEAVLRSFSYHERLTPEEHAAARASLERAVQQAPGYADGWAMLSSLYSDEYAIGFNPQPDPLGRALDAARRSVDAAPSNHRAHFALAYALFFRKEFQAFRNAAERALALNPLDGSTTEFLGLCMAYAGDWERGCALAERAMQLNPNHPGKYWYPAFFNAYRKGDYRGALNLALKINMPDVFYTPLALAVANGQLEKRDASGKALRDLLTMQPDYAAMAREDLGKWFDQELVEHVIDGLRKAGLEIAGEDRTPILPAAAGKSSDKIFSEEAFWIAVLPFKYSGGNPDIAALSDGLTEEIASGLSRFSYLRVIAGGATSRYAQQTVDVRLAGKELGARYVMEGSVRQSGNKLRIAVQLLDTKSGANLWTETFDRDLQTADIFELQDEITDRVVATIADQYGVLARSMAMATAAKSPETLTPYEAVLRFFLYAQRVTPEDHLLTRTVLEHAVETQPDYADAWACLATMIVEEHRISFNPQPNSLDRALQSAERAVDADPASQMANYALAVAHYFRGDLGAFRSAAERALALNTREGSVIAYLGMLFCYSGDWERGIPLTARAMDLNPHHPGWYYFAPFFDQYRQRHYAEALTIAQKINLPESWITHYVTAMAQAHLGNRPAAKAAVERTLQLWPDFEQNFVAGHLQKWVFNQPELIAQIIESLELAGFRLLRPGRVVDRSGEHGN